MSTETATLRLSGVLHHEFDERSEPVFDLDPSYVGDAVRWCGHTGDDVLRRTGTTFVTMGAALLDALPGPLPETDAVLLAYDRPDLLRPEVAGCYLADRLPGSPVPFSVSGQGGCAAFTALGIAQGMLREGVAETGALFVIDQQVAAWDREPAAPDPPDASALVVFGAEGDVAVRDLTEVRTAEPGDPTPSEAVVRVRADHPGIPAVVGPELAAVLDTTDTAEGIEPAGPGAPCTGVWAAVAARWPLRAPLLLADRQPDSGRVHACVLEPAR
ncbi:hypothetical protein [Pseudonocardia endophytica]|uniref:3-oxoacyl-ACP synthase n=1 Tax=Pseudonocardia endophytica TaxID=401976 RepID=A0A4R1HXM2_PSEEN|nr:hypothetical protein [Pseudonocardia endophytica]TCK22302.1 hypothetical protein EV378_6303 [Pseudonocardia endophytica]